MGWPEGRRAHNWRGGRVVEPRGYVLVYVGKGHPLADCRGYAYEHRLKAYETGALKLDGTLRHVHHGDETPGNNAPENLEALTPHEHRARHRRGGSNLRNPGEPNPTIGCACGCGAEFLKFDDAGRPRRFLPGHNPQRAPTRDQILDALKGGPKTHRDLYERIFTSPRAVITCLSKLKREGLVKKAADGAWVLGGGNG